MEHSLSQTQNTLSSYSITQPISLKTLQTLQDNLYILKSTSQSARVLPAYQHYLQLLQQLNACSNLDELFADSLVKDLFFIKFLPVMTKNIMKYQVDNSDGVKEILVVLVECVQEMGLLGIKVLYEGNYNLGEVINLIVDLGLSYCDKKFSNANDGLNREKRSQSVASLFFDRLISELNSDSKVLGHAYKVICDLTGQLSLKMVTLICAIIGNLNLNYTCSKDPFQGYACKIRKVLWHKLLYIKPVDIDNCTTEGIKAVLDNFELLCVKTLGSVQGKYRDLNTVKLKVSLACLSSNNFTALFGLRIAGEVVTSLEDLEIFQLSVHIQQIFEKVYGNPDLRKTALRDGHGLLIYMLKTNLNLFECEELSILWTILKETNESDKAIFKKILSQISQSVQFSVFLEKLVSETLLKDHDKIEIKDLAVLSQIYNYFSQSKAIVAVVINSYWRMLVKINKQTNSDVFHILFQEYTNLIRSHHPGTYIWEIINDCTSEVDKDNYNFGFFKMTMLFATESFTNKNPRIPLAIKSLYSKKNILDLYVNHIKSFKNQFCIQKKEEVLAFDGQFYPHQILEQITFFEQLLSNQLLEGPSLTYKYLFDIWDSFVEHPLIPAERNLFFQAISRALQSNTEISMSTEDFREFFQEILCDRKTQSYLTLSEEGKACFQSFFIAINETLGKLTKINNGPKFIVKVFPDVLEGFDVLWDLIMSCENEYMTESLITFLFNLYTSLADNLETDLSIIRKNYVEKCLAYIQKNPINALRLLSQMMDDSEIYGIGKLNPHSHLVNNDEPISIVIASTYNFFSYERIELEFEPNSTVFDLLQRLSKLLQVSWDEITLFKSLPSNPISYTQNGRTLSETGLMQASRLGVQKRILPKVDLLVKHDILNPKAEKIFIKIFEEYSDNGKMSSEQCTTFMNFCLGNYYDPDVDRIVRDIFLAYDLDRDEHLTQNDFLSYYHCKCQKDPDRVWKHLYKHGQRNDLKDKADLKTTESCLIAYIIRSNQQYFELLFSLLDSEDNIASEAWELLCRVPTSQKLFNDIFAFKGVKGVVDPKLRDWNSLLDLNSKYKLLYSLNIVEYLMHNQETWQIDFIEYGGLDHL